MDSVLTVHKHGNEGTGRLRRLLKLPHSWEARAVVAVRRPVRVRSQALPGGTGSPWGPRMQTVGGVPRFCIWGAGGPQAGSDPPRRWGSTPPSSWTTPAAPPSPCAAAPTSARSSSASERPHRALPCARQTEAGPNDIRAGRRRSGGGATRRRKPLELPVWVLPLSPETAQLQRPREVTCTRHQE